MLTNAEITGWQRRTGSDAQGRPTFAGAALARPARCLRARLNAAQVRLLATVGKEADETVLHPVDRDGAPDVDAGDRVQLDSAATWHEVVRRERIDRGAVSHRTLFVKEL